ncbi:hypothetical protein V5O48_001154 [Marasmius crinis-equi]|uniref:G-patch domain-containing protein n=1 Tax=Marasmius crinis-equi TaxID=585013 RepID=A0ABR3FZA6_9AGAR
MTSRLKKKLGDLGVDAGSTKANESFCLIGTPLPPLEKSKDTGEFVPLWKQEVRDEKGRRRLHGAFTGGFSAGYFNSVGSKEGWTPATFVSSRNDRAKNKKHARPEDFMDEEDLQELQESRKLVDATEEMDLTGGTQAELSRRGAPEEETEQDAISSALQAAILPATKDSAGARILKKMGWKVGQGIGPRVTLRQRRLQDLQASTGRIVTGDDLGIPADDEEANKHTYAPRDTPVLVVGRKDNFHGIGYKPGMSLNETLGQKASGSGISGPNISAGFGLGALNDADEDDLDVYDAGPSRRNRTAYDIADEDGDDRVTIGGRANRKKGPSNIAPTTTETFRDGTVVLPGFTLYDKPVAEDRWFPLPDVPKGWRPNPKKIWEQEGPDKENIKKEEDTPGPVPHHKWKSGMSAEERGNLLGETPLPSAPKSVFDYMSQKDRERLKNISASLASGASQPTQPSATEAPARIPSTEPHIASAALRGYQPFTTDAAKQARYTLYLQSQADPTSGLSLRPRPNQSVDEFNKELDEYAKSAQIFKPMSGAMAGRFTSAVVVEHGPKIHEGLHQPTAEEQRQQEEEEERKRQEEKLSPKENAAKMGMYGPMTREATPWQPARLLCKRFGVKDPNPDMSSSSAEAGPSTTAAQAASSMTTSFQADDVASTGLSQQQIEAATASMWDTSARVGGASNGKRDLANVGLGDDDTQGRDTLTYERPPVDVFKAIFASDDEDSDDDEGGKVPEDEEKESAAISDPPPLPSAAAPPPAKTVEEPVDLATFKPTFVPREARVTKTDDSSNDRAERKKKKKDKEKRKAIVSFAMDEGGDGDEGVTEPRPKKKKKRDREGGKVKEKDRDRDKSGKAEELPVDDDDMWVEKPPPTGVEAQSVDVEMVTAPESAQDVPASVSAPPRGRKRAIDFM